MKSLDRNVVNSRAGGSSRGRRSPSNRDWVCTGGVALSGGDPLETVTQGHHPKGQGNTERDLGSGAQPMLPGGKVGAGGQRTQRVAATWSLPGRQNRPWSFNSQPGVLSNSLGRPSPNVRLERGLGLLSIMTALELGKWSM